MNQQAATAFPLLWSDLVGSWKTLSCQSTPAQNLQTHWCLMLEKALTKQWDPQDMEATRDRQEKNSSKKSSGNACKVQEFLQGFCRRSNTQTKTDSTAILALCITVQCPVCWTETMNDNQQNTFYLILATQNFHVPPKADSESTFLSLLPWALTRKG